MDEWSFFLIKVSFYAKLFKAISSCPIFFLGGGPERRSKVIIVAQWTEIQEKVSERVGGEIPAIRLPFPRHPRRRRGVPKLPDLHLRCTGSTCGRAPSFLQPLPGPLRKLHRETLGALVTEHGRLSATSRRVVMLMVMEHRQGPAERRCRMADQKGAREHLTKSQSLQCVLKEELFRSCSWV